CLLRWQIHRKIGGSAENMQGGGQNERRSVGVLSRAAERVGDMHPYLGGDHLDAGEVMGDARSPADPRSRCDRGYSKLPESPELPELPAFHDGNPLWTACV